jgi:hypothetical protein
MSIDKKPEQLFDVRLHERYRVKELFSDKEYRKWMTELTDTQENAQRITTAEIFGHTGEKEPE